MATRKFSTQLAGQIGEALVVAELGRRGIVATSFAGNVPDIDLLAYADGQTLPLQVKAWRRGTIQLDAKRFLQISMDGTTQVIHGFDTDLEPTLVYVFVKIGERLGEDKFYILTQGELQQMVHNHHSALLAKHSGVRPRNPESTHLSLVMADLEKHQNCWDLVAKRLSNTSNS